MSFFTRYELVRLIPNTAVNDSDAKSFHALERESRHPTLLHMVTPGSLAQRVKAVDKAPGVIEIGEFAGSVYLITEVAEPFSGLSKWLDDQASKTAEGTLPRIIEDRVKTGPIAVSPPVAARVSEPVEGVGFTSTFSSAIEAATKTSGLPSLPAAQASLPVEPLKPTAAEDEFREMLKAQPVPVSSPTAAAPIVTPVVAPLPVAGPIPAPLLESDGFTAMFGVRGRGSAQEDSLAGIPLADLSRSSSPTGSIALPEQLPGHSPAAAVARGNLGRPSTPTPDLAPKETSHVQGEFTRLMGGSPAAQEAGEFTRLMGSGQADTSPLAPAVGGEISGLFASPFPKDKVSQAADVDSVWITPVQPPVVSKPSAQPLLLNDESIAAAPSDGFTQQFFRKPAAHKALSQEPSDSSEFTKFFGPGLKGGAMNVEEEVARHEGVAEPGARPFMKAGEFTRMFGQADSPDSPQDAPPRRPLVRDDKGGVSRMFAPGELGPIPAAASAPEAEPTKAVIGEYTRIIGGSNPVTEQPTPNAVFGAGVESPEDAKKRQHKWMLIGGGVLIAILLVAVIGLLVTRK